MCNDTGLMQINKSRGVDLKTEHKIYCQWWSH
jgi:hypothetical protein